MADLCRTPRGRGQKEIITLGGVSKRGGQSPVTLRLAEVMIGDRNGHIVSKRKRHAWMNEASGML